MHVCMPMRTRRCSDGNVSVGVFVNMPKCVYTRSCMYICVDMCVCV